MAAVLRLHVCVCVYVMFCQRLLSLMLSIRICCGSVSVCLKERNWVKGNQSAAPILRCEAERQRESKAERDKERRRERADYILVTPCFVPFTFGIIREVLLDQHGCYRAPLSSSWVPQLLQTNSTIYCQSLLVVFKLCYFAYVRTCAEK